MTNKTSRKSRREKRQQQQRRQITRNLLIIVGVVLLLAAGILYGSLRPVGDVVEITPRDLPNANGRQLGDPNAPVVLEVFEDFQCPACLEFTENIEPALLTNYVETGKVLFIFRFNPFINNQLPPPTNQTRPPMPVCVRTNKGSFGSTTICCSPTKTVRIFGAYSNRRLQAFAKPSAWIWTLSILASKTTNTRTKSSKTWPWFENGLSPARRPCLSTDRFCPTLPTGPSKPPLKRR